MSVEKLEQRLLGLFGVGAFEAVSGAFECEQFGFDSRSLELVDQPHRLLVSDLLVLGAVNAEHCGKWPAPGLRSREIEWQVFVSGI
jgi:hypothetical protein